MSADTIIDGVAAVSTAIAAGAAVWFGAIQPRRRRPALNVGDPQTIWAQTETSADTTARLPRLLAPIANNKSRDAAEDAQVIIRKISSGQDLHDLKDRSMIGFAFRWGGVDSSRTLIPPSAARQLELGHLTPDGFSLNIDGQAGDRAVWWDAYAQIDVSVAARNSPAIEASFLVKLDHHARDEEKLVGSLLT